MLTKFEVSWRRGVYRVELDSNNNAHVSVTPIVRTPERLNGAESLRRVLLALVPDLIPSHFMDPQGVSEVVVDKWAKDYAADFGGLRVVRQATPLTEEIR